MTEIRRLPAFVDRGGRGRLHRLGSAGPIRHTGVRWDDMVTPSIRRERSHMAGASRSGSPRQAIVPESPEADLAPDAPHVAGRPIAELDRVVLQAQLVTGKGVLTMGTKGTVVYRYADGLAFEVEFLEPFHALVTLRREEIAPR